METEPLSPVAAERPTPSRALGRPADLWATLLASFGAILAVVAALWFFLGFAENDQRPEHLFSALILTGGLFIFAVAPFAVTANLARLSYRKGGRKRYYGWVIFLMVPWIILGVMSVRYTPLPAFIGVSAAFLAIILMVWAITSLLLDWRNHSAS